MAGATWIPLNVISPLTPVWEADRAEAARLRISMRPEKSFPLVTVATLCVLVRCLMALSRSLRVSSLRTCFSNGLFTPTGPFSSWFSRSMFPPLTCIAS